MVTTIQPSACAAQVARILNKSWHTLARHEQALIEYLCGLGGQPELIASEIVRGRAAAEVAAEAKSQGKTLSQEKWDEAISDVLGGMPVANAI